MSWASWSDFFAMGGHGLYVWGSYVVTLAVLALEAALVAGRRRKAVRQLERR
jgi:heme exporter protein D